MTVDRRHDLERLVAIERELARRRADRPLDHRSWLPGQHAFLSSSERYKLFRAGRQSAGKTEAGAAETIWRMLGQHPFREVRPAPVKGWVVCGGGEQSQIVQERLWSLVPKGEVAPGFAYDPRKGAFLGKYPRLRLRNGSEIWIKSGQQDRVNLSSGTIDFAWVDEPPDDADVWSELLARTMRLSGDIYATLTPLHRPTDWLKAICSSPGKTTPERPVADYHFRLRPENLIPVGSTSPLVLPSGVVCDQRWIDEITASTVEHERPVVLDGEWEMRSTGAYFGGVWDPAVHVAPATAVPRGRTVCLGIDHGSRPGKQVAVLLVVDETGTHPAVFVLDLYTGTTGRESPEDDAAGIIAMLARHGLKWHLVDHVMGDRVHLPGSGQQKSNKDLAVWIAKALKVAPSALRPEVRTAKRGEGRGAGSLTAGSRWLYLAMARPGGFQVHPRCQRVIDAVPKYDLTEREDGAKDVIDAIRYGLDPWIFGYRRFSAGG